MAETLDPVAAARSSRSAQVRQTSTTYKSNQYDTKGLMYPNDLMNENSIYGGNYVIFYINVHQESQLARGREVDYVDAANITRGQQGELRGVGSFGLGAAVAAVGATTGYASGISGRAASAIGVDLNERGQAVGKVLDTVGGLAAGGAVIAAVGGPKAAYRQQKRAIALHLPTDLTSRYSMTWEESSLAGTTALAMAMEGAGKALLAGTAGAAVGGLVGKAFNGKRGAVVGAALGGAAAGGAVLAGTAGKVAANYGAGLALQIPGAGEALSKSSGVAANPKKEQLFKAVDYRTFTFTYQFFPRSAQEAQNVRDIIQEFKLHMHPEYKDAAGNFLYLYPSEFDIFYYQNGRENTNLHRHTSCVLTDMVVSYTPQATVSMFPDGMPTQINVSLTFKELALLTKESILNGY